MWCKSLISFWICALASATGAEPVFNFTALAVQTYEPSLAPTFSPSLFPTFSPSFLPTSKPQPIPAFVGEHVQFNLTVGNLDNEKLQLDVTSANKVKEAYVSKVALEAGNDVQPAQVLVFLTSGSTVFHTAIAPSVGISAKSIQLQLFGTQQLAEHLASVLANVPGIANFSTGPLSKVTITDISIVNGSDKATADLPRKKEEGFNIKLPIIGVGVLVALLSCAAFLCLYWKKKRANSSEQERNRSQSLSCADGDGQNTYHFVLQGQTLKMSMNDGEFQKVLSFEWRSSDCLLYTGSGSGGRFPPEHIDELRELSDRAGVPFDIRNIKKKPAKPKKKDASDGLESRIPPKPSNVQPTSKEREQRDLEKEEEEERQRVNRVKADQERIETELLKRAARLAEEKQRREQVERGRRDAQAEREEQERQKEQQRHEEEEKQKQQQQKQQKQQEGNADTTNQSDSSSDSESSEEAFGDGEIADAKRTVASELKRIKSLKTNGAQSKAMKLLLRKWHPDKNPGQVAVATVVFQYIQGRKGNPA